jgi:hypothetical protein
MLAAAKEKDKLELPTPVFDVTKTRIVTSSNEASGSGTREDWTDLENSALKSWDRKGKKPIRLLSDETRLSTPAGSRSTNSTRADIRFLPC